MDGAPLRDHQERLLLRHRNVWGKHQTKPDLSDAMWLLRIIPV